MAETTEGPYAPVAAGGDADARLWRVKTELAAAETAGDAAAVKKLQAELDAVNKELRDGEERAAAASSRQAAAKAEPAARTAPPAGRSTEPKQTTTDKK
jgi:hypothetical protein